MMELLKIKPCDNTFFGTGQQFNFGDNDFIESKEIPYPSVFFGAIFTAILVKNKEFRLGFFKDKRFDHEKILTIGNIYIYDEVENEAYVAAPKDIFFKDSYKAKCKGDVHYGRFEKVAANNRSSLKLPYYLKSPEDREYKRMQNSFINIEDIYKKYVKKLNLGIKFKFKEDIFIQDVKIGIGTDADKRIVEEGKLYRRQQTEFKNNLWSYVVEYKIEEDYLNKYYPGISLETLEKGYLKLGGENKAAKFEKVNIDIINKFQKEQNKFQKEQNKFEGKQLKLICISDTFFRYGIEKAFENKFEILGIVNDKPIYIGGIDLKGQNKKAVVRKMYKGYSAGTVILLKYIGNRDTLKELRGIMNENKSKGFNKFIIMEDIYNEKR